MIPYAEAGALLISASVHPTIPYHHSHHQTTRTSHVHTPERAQPAFTSPPSTMNMLSHVCALALASTLLAASVDAAAQVGSPPPAALSRLAGRAARAVLAPWRAAAWRA